MTRKELYYELYAMTNSHAKVERIFSLFGKLSPEPREKPQVPTYNVKKVRRVGTLVQRMKVTNEQRAAAKAIIEKLGLL